MSVVRRTGKMGVAKSDDEPWEPNASSTAWQSEALTTQPQQGHKH